jgi:undecaprenyl-diphosphatase
MIETLQQIDKDWFIAINTGLQHPVLDFVCPFMRQQNNWYVLYLLLLYVSYRIWGKKVGWVVLGAALLVLVSDQISANLIKNTVQRLRPCNNPELTGLVRTLVGCGKGYSFISAHATNHFAIAVLFSRILHPYFKWTYVIALPWAALIAFSQVYVGVHYPFDVICGAALGAVLGYVTSILLSQKLVTPHG